MLTELQEELANRLFDISAIKFGQFRLKLHEKDPNAPLSPIYIDLRILRSFPDVMRITVAVYKDLVKTLNFDIYADVPTAATPIVAILSHDSNIPMISPRIQEKKYGAGNSIDGIFTKGQRIVLIDDLITKADSKLEAIAILEKNKLLVKDVVVLIDREQGGADELGRKGYTLHSAFILTDLLNFYYATGKISQELYTATMDYIKIR